MRGGGRSGASLPPEDQGSHQSYYTIIDDERQGWDAGGGTTRMVTIAGSFTLRSEG